MSDYPLQYQTQSYINNNAMTAGNQAEQGQRNLNENDNSQFTLDFVRNQQLLLASSNQSNTSMHSNSIYKHSDNQFLQHTQSQNVNKQKPSTIDRNMQVNLTSKNHAYSSTPSDYQSLLNFLLSNDYSPDVLRNIHDNQRQYCDIPLASDIGAVNEMDNIMASNQKSTYIRPLPSSCSAGVNTDEENNCEAAKFPVEQSPLDPLFLFDLHSSRPHIPVTTDKEQPMTQTNEQQYRYDSSLNGQPIANVPQRSHISQQSKQPQQLNLNTQSLPTQQSLINNMSAINNGNYNKFMDIEAQNITRISSSVTSRITQGLMNAVRIKSAIQAYLNANDPLDAGERTVIIMTSKVAQKSYGTEKRFLCPPPTIMLVGSSWWTTFSESQHSQQKSTSIIHDESGRARSPPSLAIRISGESANQQSGKIEWYSSSGEMIYRTGTENSENGLSMLQNGVSNVSIDVVGDLNSGKHRTMLGETSTVTSDDSQCGNEPLAGGRCVLRQLYINDADEKRKKVQCLVEVQLANGLKLGTLSSRGIKVISKPTKKRQSVKNMELCIYHGTTVSLFNRVRSQTGSTKYLGVASTSEHPSVFNYPGRLHCQSSKDPKNESRFATKTSSWDPFIIWIVDPYINTNQASEPQNYDRADEFIGYPSLVPTIPYPKPPKIALKNKTNQPLAIRYNQQIVLQCLTTGLVSPVMIIRRVDKVSTVVGGAHCPCEFDPSFSGGGEFGDEVLGDPVSQLHKIALQIVQHDCNDPTRNRSKGLSNDQPTNTCQPSNLDSNSLAERRTRQTQAEMLMPQKSMGPANYLACLKDLVGTHNSTNNRTPIKGSFSNIDLFTAAVESECFNYTARALSAILNSNTPFNTEVLNRKRCLSMVEELNDSELHTMEDTELYGKQSHNSANKNARRRVDSWDANSPTCTSIIQQNINVQLPDYASDQRPTVYHDKSATANRKHSIAANNGQALAEYGAFWSEDISDNAVWTIVGTECARYTFWTPAYLNEERQMEKQFTAPLSTPFPCLTHFTISSDMGALPSKDSGIEQNDDKASRDIMTASGENFTRDLQIWFGDIKAPITEYRSREMLVCWLPTRAELLKSVGLNRRHDLLENDSDVEHKTSNMPYSIRILLVRGDGVVYKTGRFYTFC
ncbi:hypothetical protein BDF20DRAFT_79333 [Mycotypha africana]|uniref:uncharacterized protein n=1 Tax=Mycotypha africana TaxID=64632 RepID=UPI002301CBA4|nr:uncharacterized protein BDF20DRAFT_79333 [Mycotypha africana]KAI8991978.1 hypothetical protein BDF20DRAFT_79333 [Mycotypha africana]